MNTRLMRAADILFPLAGIVAVMMDFPYILTEIFMYYYTLQVLSLCAADSFRHAAARESDVQGVNRCFGGGLAQLGMGFLLCAVMSCLDTGDFAYTTSTLLVLCSVTFVLIEQLFEERARAIGRGETALQMGIIFAVLFVAGVGLETVCELEEPLYGIFLFHAAGLGAAIAALLSHRVEPLRGLSFKPRNIRFCLKAGVQTLLFPTLLFFMLTLEIGRGEAYLHAVERQTVLPLCIGLIPWRLSCAVQRRPKEESRAISLMLVAAGALGVMACLGFKLLPYGFEHIELVNICADTLVLSMLCSMLVFCAPGVRMYAGAALVVTAGWIGRIHAPYVEFAAIALCILAVIVNAAYLKRDKEKT